jgi:hypothetical protein
LRRSSFVITLKFVIIHPLRYRDHSSCPHNHPLCPRDQLLCCRHDPLFYDPPYVLVVTLYIIAINRYVLVINHLIHVKYPSSSCTQKPFNVQNHCSHQITNYDFSQPNQKFINSFDTKEYQYLLENKASSTWFPDGRFGDNITGYPYFIVLNTETLL